jgi:hypothetical protein
MERENRSSSTTQNLAAIMYTLLRSSKSWNVTYNSFDKLGPGPYIKDIHAARKTQDSLVGTEENFERGDHVHKTKL